jgi:multicomponent Na+:H+ antiporter subunit G
VEWLWTLQTVAAAALIIGGAFVMLVGSIGINRLPDFYSRTHAAANVDTLGILLFVGGLAVHEGLTINSAKLGLIVLFLVLTSPVASHALARRALVVGLVPWFGGARPTAGSADPAHRVADAVPPRGEPDAADPAGGGGAD